MSYSLSYLFPIWVLLAITLTACSHADNAGQIKALSRNLEVANGIIGDDNQMIYHTHENSLHDPITRPMAELWGPAIMAIKNYAGNMVHFMDSLKQCIKEMPGDKRSAIQQLINGQANVLYSSIAGFNGFIDTVFNSVQFMGDSLLLAQIRKDMVAYKRAIAFRFSAGADSALLTESFREKWVHDNFSGVTPEMAIAMLNKVQNDVLHTEHSLLTYINSMFVYHRPLYFDYMPIATLSSSAVKAGDSIEVRAGMGTFYELEGLQITIDGKPVALNPQHTVVYPFVVKGNPGTYSVPVTIQYKEWNDRNVHIKKSLKYTIVP